MKRSLREKAVIKNSSFYVVNTEKDFLCNFQSPCVSLEVQICCWIYFTYSLARWERNGGKNEYLSRLHGIFLARALKWTQIWGDLECRWALLAHVWITSIPIADWKASRSPQSLSRDSFKVKFNCWHDVIFARFAARLWVNNPAIWMCYLTPSIPFRETRNFFPPTLFQ